MDTYISRIRTALIAIVSLSIATLLTFPLANFVIYSRDLLFVAAVIIASRYAGFTAGLAVSFASVGIFDWFFDNTPHVLDFSVGGVMRAIVFTSVSLLVASIEQRRRHAIEKLEESNRTLRGAVEEIKTLRGLLPICMYCKQIRTDAETWVAIEEYIRKHSEAQFSHGLCPGCYRKHYPDIYNEKHKPTSSE